MIPNLIDATLQFLNTHSLNTRTIETHPVTYQDDGTYCMHMTLSDSFGFNPQAKEVPFPIQITSIFTMLDTYVDTVYPNCAGQNFKKRYQALPNINDREIIFKELFRIFRAFRNAIIHDCNTIVVDNQKITFPAFSISVNTLNILYSLACEFFSNASSRYPSPAYHLAVMRYYYDLALSALNGEGFVDDIGTSFLCISTDIRVKITVRYCVENPTFELFDDYLVIH